MYITITAEKLVKLLVEKLDENWTFQFQTKFTKIALVSVRLEIKSQ